MRTPICLLTLAAAAGAASAQVYITEFLYSGSTSEFVEFTNLSNAPVDMTGWSYDDDSRVPGEFDLSGAGVIAPGESFVICEGDPGAFAASWNLSGVTVLGPYSNNLGRDDEINLFDSSSALVDRLSFGDDVNFPGSIRAKDFSGNPLSGAEGQNDIYQWVLSASGDSYGSWLSAEGDVGNPGQYVPTPAALSLLGLAALVGKRRR
ncbi:MAG: lamin tail domain-containing protein [Phycisphaerales bacterium]|nr:lamin tail domain-containing protein [Phycisphaerales bacterium]